MSETPPFPQKRTRAGPNGATCQQGVYYHTVVAPAQRGESQLMHFETSGQRWEYPPAGRKHPKSDPSKRKGRFRLPKMTLKQACSSEYQGAQDAFKDSMIH